MEVKELDFLIRGCRWCEPKTSQKMEYVFPTSKILIVFSTIELCQKYESGKDPSLKILKNLIQITRLESFKPQTVPLLKCASFLPTNDRLSVCSPFLRSEIQAVNPMAVIVSEPTLGKYLNDLPNVTLLPEPTSYNIPKMLAILSHLYNKISNEN